MESVGLPKMTGFRASNAPWAIVPLNPNELSREQLKAVVREVTSTGIWNGFDDTIDDRCAFSLRKIKMTMFVKIKGRTLAVARVRLLCF